MTVSLCYPWNSSQNCIVGMLFTCPFETLKQWLLNKFKFQRKYFIRFQILAEHLDMDFESLSAEWDIVRGTVSRSNEKSPRDTMIRILKCHHENSDVANIIKIICSLLVVAVTTADCECGFSVLKLTKTALRYCLSQKHLNYKPTMLIHIACPPREIFNFTLAKQKFNSQKNRRVVWICVGSHLVWNRCYFDSPLYATCMLSCLEFSFIFPRSTNPKWFTFVFINSSLKPHLNKLIKLLLPYIIKLKYSNRTHTRPFADLVIIKLRFNACADISWRVTKRWEFKWCKYDDADGDNRYCFHFIELWLKKCDFLCYYWWDINYIGDNHEDELRVILSYNNEKNTFFLFVRLVMNNVNMHVDRYMYMC